MMRIGLRFGRATAMLLAVLLSLAMVLLVAANVQPGRAAIERMLMTLTDGQIVVSGLAGRFPDSLHASRIEVRDASGLWLTIEGLQLDWAPIQLVRGTVDVGRLQAQRVRVDRRPRYGDGEEGSPLHLPMRISLQALRVDRLDLTAELAGQSAVLAIDGAADLVSLERAKVDLSVRRLDGEGQYELDGQMQETDLNVRLMARESAHGLLSSSVGLTELGEVSLQASLQGPRAALTTQVTLAAGSLRGAAVGTLDLEQDALELEITASAPPMQLRPGLSWQAIALDANVSGPFLKPVAAGTLRIDELRVADTAAHRIMLDLQGSAGRVDIQGKLEGLRIPGPQPDLLTPAPLLVEVSARLDAPDRPVAFHVKHPLFNSEGELPMAGDGHGTLLLSLPNLAPFAAAAGTDVQGSLNLRLKTVTEGETTRLDLDGTLGIAGGAAPWRTLFGDQALMGASVVVDRQTAVVSRLQFDAKTLTLSADGRLGPKGFGLQWKAALSDLSAFGAAVTGRLAGRGQISGAQDEFGMTADLDGEVATPGVPSEPIAAKLRVEGLPRAPSGRLTVQGALDRSPLVLAISMTRGEDDVIQIMIDRAQWKSGHASGRFALVKNATLPTGKLDLRMAHLADLQGLLGYSLDGAITATLETAMPAGRPRARLNLAVENAELKEFGAVGRATLVATVDDPLARPAVDGSLMLESVSADSFIGSARLAVSGPADALNAKLSASISNLADAEFQLIGAAVVDAQAKMVAVSSMTTAWKGETLRLLAPVRIGFADGITLDRLRLGLRQGVLKVAGRLGPTLDLAVSVQDFPADLAKIISPNLAADGLLRAHADLSGSLSRPQGSARLQVAEFHLREGDGRFLPPANLNATAQLTGETAWVDGKLVMGPHASIRITGPVPMDPAGLLDLHSDGFVDLRLLDPLLSASGRRVRGQFTLNGRVTGPFADPTLEGTLKLANGEVQDYVIGAHISAAAGVLQFDGDEIRITQLEGRAGPGRIAVNGTVRVRDSRLPLNLTLTAGNARPLSSDRLTVHLSSDLTVRGEAAGRLTAAGIIRIHRAEIRIPERMPTRIAVLDVRTPGAPPPPPPAPAPDIALDLKIDAPREIFVRGRGLDAELGGTVRVQGTAAKPQPDGGFAMRRGQFTLAGQTVIFKKGEVGFQGAGLTDPSLDFITSTSSDNITATLAVSGTASKPKITLSSVPALPQDEVIARLLFEQSTASLNPLELAQIAAAIGSLTGLTPAVGDPLASVRKGLGLDRLSLGSGKAGPTLEAGRYVAPGVYVGARPGLTGSGTQGMVQIDITRDLKLEGTIGTGSHSATGSATGNGTNSIGLRYEFEY